MKQLNLICLAIFLGGCSHSTCLDGSGEDSYFQNPNKTINEELHQINTPDSVLNSRLGYIKYECDEPIGYYIRTSEGDFVDVPGETFDDFMLDFNKSCEGCLDFYASGCC